MREMRPGVQDWTKPGRHHRMLLLFVCGLVRKKGSRQQGRQKHCQGCEQQISGKGSLESALMVRVHSGCFWMRGHAALDQNSPQ